MSLKTLKWAAILHPASFFIPVVDKLIPYSWAKTWHLQLMLFWIASGRSCCLWV